MAGVKVITKIVGEETGCEWEYGKVLTGAKGKVFVICANTYTNENGIPVDVLFLPSCAFIFKDEITDDNKDDDIIDLVWDYSDVKTFIKDEKPGSAFPTLFGNQYVPIAELGSDHCDEEVLASLGLSEYADDILKRLKGLESIGYEVDQL